MYMLVESDFQITDMHGIYQCLLEYSIDSI